MKLKPTMTHEDCLAVRRVFIMCEKFIKHSIDIDTLYPLGNGIITGREVLQHIAAAKQLVSSNSYGGKRKAKKQ